MKISKKVFIALVLLVLSFSLYAQGIKFGVKAGFNASSISGFEDFVKKVEGISGCRFDFTL